MLKLSVVGNCDHVVNIISNCQIMLISFKAYFFRVFSTKLIGFLNNYLI